MLKPIVGEWYRDLQSGLLFEVVARDEEADTIEVQYRDGEITEYETETWRELTLENAEAPEDWRAPYELDDPDAEDPDATYHPEDWNNPLNEVEPESTPGLEDY